MFTRDDGANSWEAFWFFRVAFRLPLAPGLKSW